MGDSVDSSATTMVDIAPTLEYASRSPGVRVLRRPKLSMAMRIVGLLLFVPGIAISCAIAVLVVFDDSRIADDDVVFWITVVPFALGLGVLAWRLHQYRWFHLTCVTIGMLVLLPGLWMAYDAFTGPRTWLWEIGFAIGLFTAGTGLGVALAGVLGLTHRRLCEG